MEGDDARRGIWLVDVPLAKTHHLRAAINTGKPASHEILENYEIPVVASVLKLYLLELPDSLVSSMVYEIVKTIYTTTAPNTSESARISVIQSTLGQLRLANIATLDAITTHFTRLIELTSAEEPYVAALASTLAPCILRPKQETSLSMTEKFNVRLVRDLFAHKDAIFGELKRASSLSHTNSGASRPRAISTDESRRKQFMEERQRAITAAGANRSRATSPFRQSFGEPRSPMPLPGHRRERSTHEGTRFPVNASTTNSPVAERRQRGSLEVPGSPPNVQPATTVPQSPPKQQPNGTAHSPAPAVGQEPNEANVTKTRDRSDTTIITRDRSDTNGSAAPVMSSSLSNPIDFMSPQHYYSSSLTSVDDNTSNSNIDKDAGAGATAPFQQRPSDQQPQPQATTNVKAEVEKRNSLTRSGVVSRGHVQRRGTGGLQRQSLIGRPDKRDSTGTIGSLSGRERGDTVGTSAGEIVQSPIDGGSDSERRGVDLVDKPMDFD